MSWQNRFNRSQFMGGSLRNFQQFSFSPYWQFKASPWLPFVLNLVSTPVSREADVDPDRDRLY
ncbi:hypothetical protein HC931_11015 [Candidatus Gracilibacteria bacterium]|nr:hypothetical protein [Candidatus Gracilibacteria bacterium]